MFCDVPLPLELYNYIWFCLIFQGNQKELLKNPVSMKQDRVIYKEIQKPLQRMSFNKPVTQHTEAASGSRALA